MAVGYNNFDVAAMTAAGVLGTNAPDVDGATADFGMALLLATARRVCEASTSCARACGKTGATTCS